MRVRNPETFYATWASSAPTEAAIDMWTYYAQAERSVSSPRNCLDLEGPLIMIHFYGRLARNCSADYTHVTNYVDTVLANGTVEEKDRLKVEVVHCGNVWPGREEAGFSQSYGGEGDE